MSTGTDHNEGTRSMKAAMTAAAILAASASAALAHHPGTPPAKGTDKLVTSYGKLHKAARANPRVRAGRNVARHGRARDGRIVWNVVRSERRRLWRALHPGPMQEHLRRARAAQIAAQSPRAVGRRMAAARGWTGAQWSALEALWTRESGWNPHALNSSSGACGIPQALPCSKIPGGLSASTETQVRWGLGYIAGRYGSPGGAWAHFTARGWY